MLVSLRLGILLVTHDLPYALELCPRAVVLDRGQVVADGATREVLADEGFMRAHRLELPAGFNPLDRMSALFIVGLGPGGPEHRTAAAERAIREADVVIGYGPYIDQCADLLAGQEVMRGTMGEELERAREAVRERARARVALVSSGDAGVHGMAARTLAMAEGVEVTVIPGVTAALAAAARLGAPLADDWATLSLSRPAPAAGRRSSAA